MKPFIAKDTKEPLVVFDKYKIGEGGAIIHDTVPDNSEKPQACEDDINLLSKYGVEKLKEMKFYGVLDRLSNSNLI